MKRFLAKELNNLAGKKVLVSGWLHSKRSHGKILFLDVRDRTGIVQCILLPGGKYTQLAEQCPLESVVKIKGTVAKRPAGSENKEIVSSDIEIKVEEFIVVSKSKTPPFTLDDTSNVNEELRLEHRYLDLRSQRMRSNIIARSTVYKAVVDFLIGKDFTYIQTPILSKSTPEGARDYLVPSRKYPGKFFALPQSPQQYKQMLMVAGFERYFQIAPCFRDEDARAERSPGEFYQIDMELAFTDQDEILSITEEMFVSIIKKHFPDKKITLTPFPRMRYDQAIKNYNTDKPDLRKDKKNNNELAFVWIVDFPLFTKQSKDDYFFGSGKSRLAPSHHMFTAPKPEDEEMLSKNPERVRSLQHDLVLNGVELGGGSIRIHKPEIQEKIWDIIGFSDEQKKQFSHLLKAFSYGVPPHGGIAPGFDRFLSLIMGEKNIREVIAFPLNGEARDPLMDSPGTVSQKQLQELHLKISEENK